MDKIRYKGLKSNNIGVYFGRRKVGELIELNWVVVGCEHSSA